MKPINVYDAKTQLSRLLERVEAGEEIVIARAGKPVARLVPIARKPSRVAGVCAGRWRLAEDWNAEAVNAEIADTFDEPDHARSTER